MKENSKTIQQKRIPPKVPEKPREETKPRLVEDWVKSHKPIINSRNSK